MDFILNNQKRAIAWEYPATAKESDMRSLGKILREAKRKGYVLFNYITK
jgi:hypothetical protein